MQWLHAQCSIYIVHFVDCWAILRQQNWYRIEQCACSVHITCIMVSSECHRRCKKHLKYLFMIHFRSTFYHQIVQKTGFISHLASNMHIAHSQVVLSSCMRCELFSTVIACPTISHKHQKYSDVSMILRRMQYQNNNRQITIIFHWILKTEPRIFDAWIWKCFCLKLI